MRTSHLFLLTVAALMAAISVRTAAAQTAPPAAGDKPAVVTNTPAAQPAAPEAAAKGDDTAAKAAAATKAKDAAGHETLSVDFPDEDVRNILRNVADLFELNIIMPEALQGKTTIKLRDVTWRQIFQNVLDPLNYTYVEDGNIIKIVSKDSLNDEPVTTEVFLINYARAVDILPTISSLVDGTKGKIVVDARSNSLVITERPTRLSRIRPIIEQLDRATDQVMIESKFVEVTNSDIKNIGVNWASLGTGVTLGAGNITQSFIKNGNQTIGGNTTVGNNNTTTGNTTTAGNTTQSNGINTTSSVTSTNGTPTSISTTGSTGALASDTSTSTSVADTLSNTLGLLNSVANADSTSRVASALFSASQFNIVLSALQTLSDVKIVSNPTIVTLNNSEATINTGTSYPLPNYTFNPQTGTQEVSGFTYKDIGIILKVTPQVNARGFIKLTLTPEVSQQNGTSTFGAAQLPIIATRKASTTISLKDGFTMGIGGMLTTQTTTGGTKIPVLGSIPGLGRLFRSDTKNLAVTNLIIFITAKTLSAEGAATEQVFDSSRVRELQLHREDLPGYRDGSDPFLPPSNSSEKTPAKKSIFPLFGPGEKK